MTDKESQTASDWDMGDEEIERHYHDTADDFEKSWMRIKQQFDGDEE